MNLSPDSVAVVDLATIYSDRSRFGLTCQITAKDESLVSSRFTDNKIVIEPKSTGNTEISVRTTDNFTGYSLLDTFKVSIKDTAIVSSIRYANIGENPEVLLYPNPSQEIIFLNLQSVVETTFEYSIMDCTGNTIKVIPLNYLPVDNIYPVEIGYLKPGFYFLRIFLISGASYTLHFIKL
jgi:hypothetical protein